MKLSPHLLIGVALLGAALLAVLLLSPRRHSEEKPESAADSETGSSAGALGDPNPSTGQPSTASSSRVVIEILTVDEGDLRPVASRGCLLTEDELLVRFDTDDTGFARVSIDNVSDETQIRAAATPVDPTKAGWWAVETLRVNELDRSRPWQLGYPVLSSVRGQLLNSDNSPASDELVRVDSGIKSPVDARLQRELLGDSSARRFTLKTDASGSFTFDHVATGTMLRFAPCGAHGRIEACRVDSTLKREVLPDWYGVEAPGEYVVSITKLDRPSVHVRVLDESGKPVPDALVGYMLDGRAGDEGLAWHVRAETDADGDANVGFLGQDEDPAAMNGRRHWAMAYKEGKGFAYAQGILKLDDAVLTITYEASSATSPISGTVVDADDGNPLPGVEVELVYGLFADTGVATATTDADGRFTFTGLRYPDSTWTLPIAGAIRFSLQVSPTSTHSPDLEDFLGQRKIELGSDVTIRLPKRKSGAAKPTSK